MIYTITLNPAVDKIVLMQEEFNVGKTNYYNDEYSVVGGKGINVGVILNNLKSDVTLLGIIGSENKEIFLKKFEELNLKHEFLINSGHTRTNYKIKNLELKQETELNGTGFTTDSNNIENLIKYLKENLKENDIVVATGSLPNGVNKDIYQQIGEIANDKKSFLICDAAKDVIKNALKAKPFLIKPNIDEIKDLLNIRNDQEDFDYLNSLVNQVKDLGAKNVLLSMGSEGSYYFDEDNSIYKVGIAKGKLVNSVGSGDSMLAGYIYGLNKNLDIKSRLQYAAASGGATAFTSWLATKDEIESYVNDIKVEKIK